MNVTVVLHPAGADARDVDASVRQVRRELLVLDVDDVSLPRSELPEGARGDAITIGTLMVTLANSTVLVAACQVLRAWVQRSQGRRVTIRSKVNGAERSVEITGSNATQHQQIVDALVRELSGEP